MKFIDPKSDIAFKKIFGNDKKKHILISFLNAVLGLSDKNAIKEVNLLSPLHLPRLEHLKESALDVKARDETGKEFIIEMQVRAEKFFTQRSVYYSASTYTRQLKKGESYDKLKPVIFIGVLDFNIFPEPDCVSHHLITNQKSLQQHIKDFSFIFVELPKFKKGLNELEGIIDQWIYFLKEAPKLSVIPSNIDKTVEEAYETADQHTWTDDELEVFDYWEREINIEKDLQKKEYEKGIKKGLKEGKEEGIKEGKEEGIKEGKEEGIKEGKELGVKEGKELGVKEGKELGVKEGMEKAKQEMINNLMKTLKITEAEAKKMLGI